jgi:hypothetical protein
MLMMLYIILAISLTSPEVSYCTKPMQLKDAQAQLLVLGDWTKHHGAYTAPVILPATDQKAVRAMNGYTIEATEADPVAVIARPCRLFGSD